MNRTTDLGIRRIEPYRTTALHIVVRKLPKTGSRVLGRGAYVVSQSQGAHDQVSAESLVAVILVQRSSSLLNIKCCAQNVA